MIFDYSPENEVNDLKIVTTFSTISLYDKMTSVTTVVELKLVDLIQCSVDFISKNILN